MEEKEEEEEDGAAAAKGNLGTGRISDLGDSGTWEDWAGTTVGQWAAVPWSPCAPPCHAPLLTLHPLSFQVALHAGSSCRRDAAPLGKRN